MWLIWGCWPCILWPSWTHLFVLRVLCWGTGISYVHNLKINILYLPFWSVCLSFPFLFFFVPAATSSSTLDNIGGYGHPWLVPNFRISIHSSTIKYGISLSYFVYTLSSWGKCSLFLICWPFSLWMCVRFLSYTFSTSISMTAWFFSPYPV